MGRKKNKQLKGKKNQKQILRSKVKELLDSKPGKTFSEGHIVKRLGFRDPVINKELHSIIAGLREEGLIRQIPDGRYQSNNLPKTIEGIIDHVSSRFAYLMIDEDEDIFIRSKDLNSAMHGDRVQVELFHRRQGRRPEGKVFRVLKRARKDLVGRLVVQNGICFVIPDNKKLHDDIFISPKNLNKAKHNDKVITEIVDWPSTHRKAEGRVSRVLGEAGHNEAEIHSIMAEFGLPFEFPDHVIAEAEKINDDMEKEARKRRDMRNVTTFTIDPEDAKDFDDAISVKKLENGNFEIGVHIADVTHYIKPGSSLEDEALERATSVYLVDRTIPMLPERLSNELCSLRPNEDKLTFSAIFEIDENAKVHKEWFGRTAIHSNRRFTYEEAQEILEGNPGDHSDDLNLLNRIAKKLKEKRFQAGAVNFETGEVKFRLDDEGVPLEVIPKIRKDAHKLVEEFMLLANRKVATFVFGKRKGKEKDTFVYRIHDNPDPEKISNFAEFAAKFGHSMDLDDGVLSHSINRLLDEIEGKPEEHVLQTLAIRSMAKARYSTKTMGHFGLAFPHYTHFTSPIRRYPDMMVHRLLQHYLDGGKSADKDEYEEKCVHSSEREKRAADAERASVKYKQVEFMARAADREYNGIISGVTEWGIYVEISENMCEGMVRLSDLTDDFYELDEKNYKVVGRSSGNEYALGEKVKVRVKNTDIDKRIIDLEFVWG